jgi:hypothetical protein
MKNLEKVRLLIDAKIASYKERMQARTRMGSASGGKIHFKLKKLETIACCEKFDEKEISCCYDFSEKPFSVASSDKKSNLLENLPIPSVEPRPPNLRAVNLSFAARLIIAIRDKFDGDAPMVYTAARVSRQVYSQIITDETRPVKKRTAIRFAFALKMSSAEAKLLLKSAGYAFSNSQTEDFILQACLDVNPPIWDLDLVNQLLKEYGVDYQY